MVEPRYCYECAHSSGGPARAMVKCKFTYRTPGAMPLTMPDLRELLSKWNTMPADEMRATIAEAASALDDAAEVHGTWPEWAEKLLRILESFGAEYEYDDEINLPDELAEWLHHYASDLKRTALAKVSPQVTGAQNSTETG